VFKIYRYLQMVLAFSRASRRFLDESEGLLDEEDPDHAALRFYCRGIVALAVLFAVLGGLVVPVAVPWLVYHAGNFPNHVAPVGATLIGLIFSIMTVFLYLFAGVATACLLAPAAFFDSPVGQKWLELIGTKNRTAARLVCLVLALVGVGVMVGVAALQAWLMHSPGFAK
jgi:hypothetical protein